MEVFNFFLEELYLVVFVVSHDAIEFHLVYLSVRCAHCIDYGSIRWCHKYGEALALNSLLLTNKQVVDAESSLSEQKLMQNVMACLTNSPVHKVKQVGLFA